MLNSLYTHALPKMPSHVTERRQRKDSRDSGYSMWHSLSSINMNIIHVLYIFQSFRSRSELVSLKDGTFTSSLEDGSSNRYRLYKIVLLNLYYIFQTYIQANCNVNPASHIVVSLNCSAKRKHWFLHIHVKIRVFFTFSIEQIHHELICKFA